MQSPLGGRGPISALTAMLVLAGLAIAGVWAAILLRHTSQGRSAADPTTSITGEQRVTVTGPARTVIHRVPVVRRINGRRVVRDVTSTIRLPGATHVVVHPVVRYRRVVVDKVVTRDGKTTTLRRVRTVPVTSVRTQTQVQTQTQTETATVSQRSTVTEPVTRTVVSTSTVTTTDVTPTTVTLTVTLPVTTG
jgi:hypothetical protein